MKHPINNEVKSSESGLLLGSEPLDEVRHRRELSQADDDKTDSDDADEADTGDDDATDSDSDTDLTDEGDEESADADGKD